MPRKAEKRRSCSAHAAIWLVAVALVVLPGLALAQAGGPASESAPQKLLILPFDMVDSSLQGEMNHGPLEADVARLRRTEAVVRRSLDAREEFDVIDPAPVQQAIARAQQSYRYLYDCNGCETDIGRAADADLVMTGWVQKISNLIININATLYDVNSGKTVGGGSVDMRGNTDASWRSSALYLTEHSLLSNYHSRQAARQKTGHVPD